MAKIKILSSDLVGPIGETSSSGKSKRPAERRELVVQINDDHTVDLKCGIKQAGTDNAEDLKLVNERFFVKKDELPKLSELSKEVAEEHGLDLPNLLKENPLEFAYEIAKRQGYEVGSKAEWMEKCGIEPVVPINDIYKVFKTYWNAESFVYTSITEDGKEEIDGVWTPTTEKIGRYNGMCFGISGQVKQYKFKRKKDDGTEYYKKGQPINCSSLAALVTLGIPYGRSKYANVLSEYNKDNAFNGHYSFNMYGLNQAINKDNYNAYFKADRQLARCRELGLEIPALHLEWKPKEFITPDKPLTSWYDIIAPHNDLREAKPGDLIFWNNDGNTEADPRVVSHVVLVLARLSYDSRNPNQPLLLLAEATASATSGVQICYYIYDDTSSISFKKSSGGNYIKIANESLSDLSQWLYFKEDDDIYTKSVNGNYLRLNTGSYVKIYNGQYVANNEQVQNARYTKEGELYSNGIRLYCGKNSTPTKLIIANESSTAHTYKKEKVEGTNEHKIPKFICRPKYERLPNTLYQDISSINPAEVGSEEGPDYFYIKLNNTTKEVYTIEFDWTPNKDLKNNYLSILSNDNKEVLRHYIPNCIGGNKYQKIKITVPINAFVSTSKKNEIGKTNNYIKIQEKGYTDTNPEGVSRVPAIVARTLKVYKGIRLT